MKYAISLITSIIILIPLVTFAANEASTEFTLEGNLSGQVNTNSSEQQIENNLDIKYNGEPISITNKDIRETVSSVAKVANPIIWAIIIASLISLAYFILFIAMIVHAIRYNIPGKIIWLILLIIFPFPVALIYYFAVKSPFDSGEFKNTKKLKK